MNFLDARTFDDQTTLDFDLCVIGAGAAAITLAQQLDKKEMRVCLLESGGPEFDAELQQAAWVDAVGDPVRRDIVSHPRQLGGATRLWGGRCVMFRPLDLEARPWANTPAWPLRYDELQTYYGRAAAVLQVPSLDRFKPQTWQAEAAYAPFFDNHLTPEMFIWCDVVDMAEYYTPLLKASPNVQLIFHANVTELVTGERDKAVSSVTVKTTNGRTHTITARAFVLAAGGMENVRLLLASRGTDSAGIGNQHDLVGRGFMDHPKSRDCGAIVPNNDNFRFSLLFKQKTDYGELQFNLSFTEQLQREEQLLNHCIYLDEPQYKEWMTPGYRAFKQVQERVKTKRFSPDLLSQLGRMMVNFGDVVDYTRKVRANRPLTPDHIPFANQLEQTADPQRRITLNDERRDQFGVPTLKLDWWLNDAEKRSLIRFHELLDAYLRRHNLGRLESRILNDPDDWPQFVNAHHPTGTLRMSHDPSQGVVDAHWRVHGMANLYVTGSAVLPSVSHANPTFTIVALAVRLAEQLKTSLT